jgi:hypothetical protein
MLGVAVTADVSTTIQATEPARFANRAGFSDGATLGVARLKQLIGALGRRNAGDAPVAFDPSP